MDNNAQTDTSEQSQQPPADQIPQPIENQQLPPQEPKKKLNWKGFFIGIIVVVIIEIFAFHFLNSGNEQKVVSKPAVVPAKTHISQSFNPNPKVTPIPEKNCTIIGKTTDGQLIYNFSTPKYSFSITTPSAMQCVFYKNANGNSSAGIQALDEAGFHEGQSLIAGGYSGLYFTIDIFPEKGNDSWIKPDQSSSDTVSQAAIAGQTVTKLTGLAGVRIGPIKHNGYVYNFAIENSSGSANTIDQILSSFRFTD